MKSNTLWFKPWLGDSLSTTFLVLYGFLERMLHMYQIDNVASFIACVKGEQRPEVIAQSMNPLGEFQGLKSVQSFGSEDIVSLFSDILIDLPVGVYFRKYIDSMIEDINASNRDGMGGDNRRGVNVADITKCIEEELIIKFSENTELYLKKIWITEFHIWIMANCNGVVRMAHQEESETIKKLIVVLRVTS